MKLCNISTYYKVQSYRYFKEYTRYSLLHLHDVENNEQSLEVLGMKLLYISKI